MAYRKLTPGILVAATHNDGKLREFRDLFEPVGMIIRSAKALNLQEPTEDGSSFLENALIKARSASEATGERVLADDSGMEAEAIGGMPGIYTADWAGEPRDFYKAMEKVERLLNKSEDPNRAARFVSTLAIVWPDGEQAIFEGSVNGTLVWPPRGDKGFGFDPVFVPKGYDQTFGEMEPAQKHSIDHRADAFAKLKDALLS